MFSLCVNDLLIKLNTSGFGCIIRQNSFAACMFADDLLLMTISIADLQQLLYICQDELQLLDMTINANKSAYVRIGDRWGAQPAPIKLRGVPIALANSITYLGITIIRNARFKTEFHSKKIKFFRSLNTILSKIGSPSECALILKIVATNCYPIIMYGLEACRPTKKQRLSLAYPYNSVFFKLFNTFNPDVIRITQYYSGVLPFEYALDLRTLKFYYDLFVLDYHSPAGMLMRWEGGGSSWPCLRGTASPPLLPHLTIVIKYGQPCGQSANRGADLPFRALFCIDFF